MLLHVYLQDYSEIAADNYEYVHEVGKLLFSILTRTREKYLHGLLFFRLNVTTTYLGL